MEKEKQNKDAKLEARKKELLAELEKIELEAKKKELLKQLEQKPKKLNKLEIKTIADATEQLFASHYLDIGYNFIENDIDIFTYFANKNKLEFKLPISYDIQYCYKIVQGIIYIARLFRYEQRMLSNYIDKANLKIKDLFFDVKKLTKENKENLENDLLKITALFADVQTMMQYLTMIFEILKIDKTKYKDVVIKIQLKDEKYKQYLDYTLVEYINDNAFWNDAFDKLEELKTFLFADNDKMYLEFKNKLKNSDTDTTIKTAIQSLKYINKDALKKAYEMQKEIQEHNNYKDVETFKSYLLNYNENDLLATSLDYLNAISDFYKDQIILKGATYRNGK